MKSYWIELPIDSAMIREARNFKASRDKIKAILKLENRDYDKFTTKDDSFIGRLGELLFVKWLKEIKGLKEDKDFIEWYKVHHPKEDFYDKWDYKLLKNEKTIDVKAAQTKLEPNPKWTFGYPGIQKPANKDYIVLVYIINNEIKVPIKGIIIGWLRGSEVATKYGKPVWTNAFAGFGYRTPNFETVVGDYYTIEEILSM